MKTKVGSAKGEGRSGPAADVTLRISPLAPRNERIAEAEPLQQVERTRVQVGGRRLDYFSGCDYFRLASHPRVVQAARDGLKTYGLNVAASRVTTGNHTLYGTLERRLAEFFRADDALLLPSGYVTGLAVAQALAGRFTHAVIDERAHVCLFDAAWFLDCPVRQFKHRDPEDLARVVRGCGRLTNPLVLTDGMFARDGSVAPLQEYLSVLPRGGMILVDDAHGAGVVGRRGRGSLEHAGVGRQRIIQTITLNKAFGAYGGVVLGPKKLRAEIIAAGRVFPGSTPVPLPLANAALAAVNLVAADERFLARLRRNTQRVRVALRHAGWDVPETPGPIVALPPLGARQTAALKRRLLAAGVYPPLIRYPGGPAGGYLRFVISSAHTAAQLENLTAALAFSGALASDGRGARPGAGHASEGELP